MKRLDPVQKQLFLEGLFLKYGYDFRQYAESSLNRRLISILDAYEGLTLLSLLEKILDNKDFFRQILPLFTINTTEFFRDPLFFKSLRENVLPILRTYPRLNIWVAGCSTGEEVYSLAVLLREENMGDRAVIYATDINGNALQKAREGVYSLSNMQQFTKNYLAAGGTKNASDYYWAEYGMAKVDSVLRENIVFSEHNLAIDGVFSEMHLILCRNVLIYFDRELQNRALELFRESLGHRGFLGIGSKESLRFSSCARDFETTDSKQNIYRLRSDRGGAL